MTPKHSFPPPKTWNPACAIWDGLITYFRYSIQWSLWLHVFLGGYLWRIRSQLEKISTVTPCCLQESTSGRNETSRSGRYLRRASPPLHPGDPEKPSETSLVKSWKGLQNPYWTKHIIFIHNIWYIKCPYPHRTCHPSHLPESAFMVINAVPFKPTNLPPGAQGENWFIYFSQFFRAAADSFQRGHVWVSC